MCFKNPYLQTKTLESDHSIKFCVPFNEDIFSLFDVVFFKFFLFTMFLTGNSSLLNIEKTGYTATVAKHKLAWLCLLLRDSEEGQGRKCKDLNRDYTAN